MTLREHSVGWGWMGYLHFLQAIVMRVGLLGGEEDGRCWHGEEEQKGHRMKSSARKQGPGASPF